MAVTATNYGGDNVAGVERALYYTRFVQLVDAFLKQTVTRGLFMEQQLIDGNKSGRFPTFGRMSGQRHVAGENIMTDGSYLETQAKDEIEVYPDRPLISPDFVDLFDDRLNSIKFRDAVLAQKTNFLARAEDLLTLFQIAEACNAQDENISGETGTGYKPLAVTGSAPGATDIESFLLNAQAAFDDNHVPAEGRHMFAAPSIRATILANKDFADKILYLDTNAGMANGSYAKGQVMSFAGFQLHFTTNMPKSNYTSTGVDFGTGGVGAGTGPADQYPAADLSKVHMIGAHTTSVGKVTVGSTGVEVEQEYKIEYQGTLHLAKLHTGQKCIRPEATAILTTTL